MQEKEAHLERCFRRNPEVEEAPLQGEVMLFLPVNASFYVLNRTMAFLWQGCDGTRTIADLLAGLAQQFRDVDAAEARADVAHAVGELLELGLIVECGG